MKMVTVHCLAACTIAPFLCSEMTGLNPCFYCNSYFLQRNGQLHIEATNSLRVSAYSYHHCSHKLGTNHPSCAEY